MQHIASHHIIMMTSFYIILNTIYFINSRLVIVIKTMGYSTGYFSKIGHFLKMAITRKIEVGISSNFLHGIRTSICIRKCNENGGLFWSQFLEITMGYSLCFFFKNWLILKNAHNSKNVCRNQPKLST